MAGAAAGRAEDGFLVTTAPVPPVRVEDGRLVCAGGPAAPARVAMLGLHVVFRIANHPEMIWATFEHVDETGEPDLAPRAAALPDAADLPDPAVAVSEDARYRLYATGASYEAAESGGLAAAGDGDRAGRRAVVDLPGAFPSRRPPGSRTATRWPRTRTSPSSTPPSAGFSPTTTRAGTTG